ncbi:NETI motif-containing protein [Sporosarcina jiandibaonis]|uniref:NETI motif-containing protein n=1 Tax=Sporosarcina jiandibaonis TaxID=2715535 RepID=UPI001556B4FC|nr:NETI motif-containing protein [Sporosarcina jiandibaonis]
MKQKKTIWFGVAENETIDECLKRMEREGYQVAGKKEEPIFSDIDGEIVPIRQIIKFKGTLK